MTPIHFPHAFIHQLTIFLLPMFMLLSLFSTITYADLTAVWKMIESEQEFQVEIQDSNHLRMSMAENFYFLVKNDDMYAVIDGRILDVIAFNLKLKQLWITKFFSKRMEKRLWRIPNSSALTPTGRIEELAGVSGSVYEAIVVNPKTGQSITQELVVTQDPRLVTLKQIMETTSQRSMEDLQNTGFAAMQVAMQESVNNDQAIMRYNNQFQMVRLHEDPIDDERFDLPLGQEIRHHPGLQDLGTAIKIMMPLLAAEW